jgi:hypothetical protein
MSLNRGPHSWPGGSTAVRWAANKKGYMSDLSLKEAELLIDEAEEMNPGPWVAHSRFVAQAAKNIAKKCPILDSQKAYIYGLLHDIGRRKGRTHLRHIIDGYNFLLELGDEDLARISLTHSFAIPYLDAYVGEHDCNPDDISFIRDFLSTYKPTDYELLIQLCDGIALPSGFCLMEKRMIDVAIRLGINEKTIPSWLERYKIKEYFEGIIRCSIYQVLPGVIEGTFGSNLFQES